MISIKSSNFLALKFGNFLHRWTPCAHPNEIGIRIQKYAFSIFELHRHIGYQIVPIPFRLPKFFIFESLCLFLIILWACKLKMDARNFPKKCNKFDFWGKKCWKSKILNLVNFFQLLLHYVLHFSANFRQNFNAYVLIDHEKFLI